MAKKTKSSNSKKGPKAWGKNLYGEKKSEDAKKDNDDDKDDDDSDGKPPWLKKESNHAILNFVKNVNEKNYAEANKYLQVALETKMKDRISAIAKEIGF